MDAIKDFIWEFGSFLIDPDLRFSVLYLNATVLLAFVIWIARGRSKPFLKWLLPREIYLHKSTLVDVKLFFANHAMNVIGLFGPVVFSPLVAYWLVGVLNGAPSGDPTEVDFGWRAIALTTVLIVVSTDFCKYWSHRLHHETRILWPFHAVHHSAEVLTPLTLARAHPMETVVRNLLISVIVGLVQGVLLFVFAAEANIYTIGGANVLYVVFNMLGSNLRHSHIWLSYGRVIEHVFISPAQHQIHHSMAVEHHNKNYGSIFALWDWVFGTLYVPESYEELRFGVADGNGAPMEQPHPTLRAALIEPFKSSWDAAKDILPDDKNEAPSPKLRP